jgi:hypothetical protein
MQIIRILYTERISQIEQVSTEVTSLCPIRDVIFSYLDQDTVYPDPGFLFLVLFIDNIRLEDDSFLPDPI